LIVPEKDDGPYPSGQDGASAKAGDIKEWCPRPATGRPVFVSPRRSMSSLRRRLARPREHRDRVRAGLRRVARGALACCDHPRGSGGCPWWRTPIAAVAAPAGRGEVGRGVDPVALAALRPDRVIAPQPCSTLAEVWLEVRRVAGLLGIPERGIQLVSRLTAACARSSTGPGHSVPVRASRSSAASTRWWGGALDPRAGGAGGRREPVRRGGPPGPGWDGAPARRRPRRALERAAGLRSRGRPRALDTLARVRAGAGSRRCVRPGLCGDGAALFHRPARG